MISDHHPRRKTITIKDLTKGQETNRRVRGSNFLNDQSRNLKVSKFTKDKGTKQDRQTVYTMFVTTLKTLFLLYICTIIDKISVLLSFIYLFTSKCTEPESPRYVQRSLVNLENPDES